MTLSQSINEALANGDDNKILQGNLEAGRAQHALNVSKDSFSLAGSLGYVKSDTFGDATALAGQSIPSSGVTFPAGPQAGLVGGDVTLSAGSRFSQAALAGELASSGPTIFLLAFFLAYLVMAAQFNSWRYPIYLLLPVPLALVGALWLVFLIGGGLDIFGLMGLLMLIGLSAKNAILYLDFVVERIGKMPFKEALMEAAKLRFRPIVMTTLTVLVISFPLIFGSGQGAEFGQRMGVVMFGGIVFSAVLTFFVVPAAFYLFERSRVAVQERQAADETAAKPAAKPVRLTRKRP